MTAEGLLHPKWSLLVGGQCLLQLVLCKYASPNRHVVCVASYLLNQLYNDIQYTHEPFNDWGWRGCNNVFPVLLGNGTKTAPTVDIFGQPPGQMRRIRGKLADYVGDHVVLSPEGLFW